MSHYQYRDRVCVAHHNANDGNLSIAIVRFVVPSRSAQVRFPPRFQIVIIDVVTEIVVEVMQPACRYARSNDLCVPPRIVDLV